MAKARKRKVRKSAVGRSAKQSKRGVKTKGRKPAKPKTTRRARVKKEGPIEGALHAAADTVQESAALRRRLAGRNTFED